MDLDRLLGIIFGILVLISVFLLPFGYFTLPSGQTSGQTFFLTIMQLVENIMIEIKQPSPLLLYEIMLIISFITMVIAGLLGFYPMRSGAIGILALIILTVVTIFHPLKGLSIPNYGIGYFATWGFSIASIVVGKFQPHMRRKLSFISSKNIKTVSQEPKTVSLPVDTIKEKPVEKTSPPETLFKPLSTSEEPELPEQSEPVVSSKMLESPPMELFSSFSTLKEQPTQSTEGIIRLTSSKVFIPRDQQPQPALSLPSPPVEISVIEEEISRIRVFLAILEEERNTGLISEEAYDRLRTRFEKMLDELDEERRRIVRSS
ncbi:MAG: hypothetical protein RMI79_07655 [Nitrososphaerota archaeon]|nr:hypothetical protein [Nitrososphaerota archaeon]